MIPIFYNGLSISEPFDVNLFLQIHYTKGSLMYKIKKKEEKWKILKH